MYGYPGGYGCNGGFGAIWIILIVLFLIFAFCPGVGCGPCGYPGPRRC